MVKEFKDWSVVQEYNLDGTDAEAHRLILHKWNPCTRMGRPNPSFVCDCGVIVPEEVVKCAKKFRFMTKLNRI